MINKLEIINGKLEVDYIYNGEELHFSATVAQTEEYKSLKLDIDDVVEWIINLK